jgi:hypothetical protein
MERSRALVRHRFALLKPAVGIAALALLLAAGSTMPAQADPISPVRVKVWSDDTNIGVILIVEGPNKTHYIDTGYFSIEGDEGEPEDFSYSCYTLEAIDIHLLPNREIPCDEDGRG